MDQALRDAANKLTRELLEQGKIIEAGWQGFQLMVVPKDASTLQRREMRMAFFAGAQHLFASIMSNGGLEESDKEPTPGDLRRMDNIHKELEAFAADFRMQRTS